VERAKAQLEALKFKESLAYAKKAETEGESAISSKLQEQVRETRDSIKRIKTVKEDVTVPQQLLDQAQAALKEKKYIEALHALNTAKERSHDIQFNSVLEVIAQARDRFVLAKKVGVDMAKAITLLNTSRDNLKLGKLQDAITYAEQSKKEVDTALEMFYKARDDVVELAKAVKFAGDLGADVTCSRMPGSTSRARTTRMPPGRPKRAWPSARSWHMKSRWKP
jgi:tetratricopeptide (TPR) repeat protein